MSTKVNKAQLKLISMMILALCKVKTVNCRSLANLFDSHANAESSMRRIAFYGRFRFAYEIDFLLYIWPSVGEEKSCFGFRPYKLEVWEF